MFIRSNYMPTYLKYKYIFSSFRFKVGSGFFFSQLSWIRIDRKMFDLHPWFCSIAMDTYSYQEKKILYNFRFLKRQQAHAKPEEERKKSMSLDTFMLSNESVCQRESGMILSKNICLIQIQWRKSIRKRLWK